MLNLTHTTIDPGKALSKVAAEVAAIDAEIVSYNAALKLATAYEVVAEANHLSAAREQAAMMAQGAVRALEEEARKLLALAGEAQVAIDEATQIGADVSSLALGPFAKFESPMVDYHRLLWRSGSTVRRSLGPARRKHSAVELKPRQPQSSVASGSRSIGKTTALAT